MNGNPSEESLNNSSLELIAFLPTFTRSDFSFSNEIPARQDQDGYYSPVWTTYNPEASRFLEVCRDTDFINPYWMQPAVMADDRAHKLRNGSIALDHITVIDVAYLLTFLSRQERFANGAFAQAFNDGTIISILRRLDQLRSQENH